MDCWRMGRPHMLHYVESFRNVPSIQAGAEFKRNSAPASRLLLRFSSGDPDSSLRGFSYAANKPGIHRQGKSPCYRKILFRITETPQSAAVANAFRLGRIETQGACLWCIGHSLFFWHPGSHGFMASAPEQSRTEVLPKCFSSFSSCCSSRPLPVI